MQGSYIMFHYVRGIPFEFNAGAYDNLNMWEQIDNGDQYTPAKKFLLTVPVVLFLMSTHYTHYDLTYFIINCMAVLAVVLPKLPSVSAPRARPFSEAAGPSSERRAWKFDGGFGLTWRNRHIECDSASFPTTTSLPFLYFPLFPVFLSPYHLTVPTTPHSSPSNFLFPILLLLSTNLTVSS